jgi:hypothetical protein
MLITTSSFRVLRRPFESVLALPIIVKDEAGRALLQATLSLASKGHLATVLL